MNGDGRVETYAYRQSVTAFNDTGHKLYGSNMYNELGNYPKIGFYRDKCAEAINTIKSNIGMYRSVFLKGQRLVKIQIEVVASRFYNAHATRTFHAAFM